MIHLNRVPQRKDAEDYWRLRGGIPPPRSTGGASGPGAVPGAGAGRVSFAGTGPAVARPAAQGDVPLTPSGLPDGASDSAGGSRQRARQGGRDGTGTFAAINLLDLGVGSSFSGRWVQVCCTCTKCTMSMVRGFRASDAHAHCGVGEPLDTSLPGQLLHYFNAESWTAAQRRG